LRSLATKHEICQNAEGDRGADEHCDTQPDESRIPCRIGLEVGPFKIGGFGFPCTFTSDDFELGWLKGRQPSDARSTLELP